MTAYVKVREFDGKIITKFLDDGVTKTNMHYTCIASITIDSVMKMDKRNYPQVYLEECKYRVKKIQISRFITAELKSNSESDSEAESKSDTELMAKLEFWFWIRHFTFNNFYPYIFVDFKQVILLLIAGHIKPFLFMPIFLMEQFI